jgi:hypothetical protein
MYARYVTSRRAMMDGIQPRPEKEIYEHKKQRLVSCIRKKSGYDIAQYSHDSYSSTFATPPLYSTP